MSSPYPLLSFFSKLLLIYCFQAKESIYNTTLDNKARITIVISVFDKDTQVHFANHSIFVCLFYFVLIFLIYFNLFYFVCLFVFSGNFFFLY